MPENSQQTATRRGKGRPFRPGQSGNPGGRPKDYDEVRALARKYTKEAVQRLVFWMQSDNPKASVAATASILDRGWGKSPQSIDVEHGAKESLADLLLRIMRARH